MEVLLLLARNTDTVWSVQRVYDVTVTSIHSVQRWLDALCTSNLIERVATPEAGYRFCADADTLAQIIELGECYQTSPVRVIEAVYKPAASAAQSFADAFKIKPNDMNQ
jgi:hypothetical protein